MLSEFHHRSRIKKEMNATFSTLTPQVTNPIDLHEHQPIILVGCKYKLYTKVLAYLFENNSPAHYQPFSVAFARNRHIPRWTDKG